MDPLDFPCPLCHAEPDQSCRNTVDGTAREIHVARVPDIEPVMLAPH